MSGHELLSRTLRQRHFAEISGAQTFETHGPSAAEIEDYLLSNEGRHYQALLMKADPTAALDVITQRAHEQIGSGRELPQIEVNDEALYKVVPRGRDVPSFSPYFSRTGVFDKAFAEGHRMADYFGLPLKSEAPRYDIYEMRPRMPTEIFIHRVAPTSELGGLATHAGGGEQVLVPNRTLYHAPTYLKTIDNSLTLQAERRVGVAIKSIGSGSAAVLMAYDAYTTTEQYQAVSAQGNQFGADALLLRYEGRTGGSFIGSVAAGAAYGAAAGSETGPGAFITGAVGGVVGAFVGDKIATMVNEHKVNHQTGTDGLTYIYGNGHWGRTHYQLDPGNSGPIHPYDAPSYTSTTTPAPVEQLAQLDYQRTTAVAALALANPATQDTRRIDFEGTTWTATHGGWMQPVEMPGIPNSFGIPSSIRADQPADARISSELTRIADNRTFNNVHYAEDVSKAYVMDYYARGWNDNGPLPDLVSKALGLPSEQHFTDPVTGQLWDASGKGGFTREETRLIDKVVIRETVAAGGEELARLAQLEQSARHANTAYGKQLIARTFEESQLGTNHGSRVRGTVPAGQHPLQSSTLTAITPASSNREMFDALMNAAQHLDVGAMRSVSNNFLQSQQGQAWLEQGHQLNQQVMAQHPATISAQQQTQMPQGR